MDRVNWLVATLVPSEKAFFPSSRQAVLFIVLREVSDQPPRTSYDSGKQFSPASRDSASWAASLRSSAYVNAQPGVSASVEMIVDCSNDTTVTSNAAGFPCVQEGKNTSAGQDWLLLLRFFFRAKVSNMHRHKKRKFYISDGCDDDCYFFVLQKIKIGPRKYRLHHFYSRGNFGEHHIGISSLCLRQLWKYSASRCSPSAEIGGVVNQTPALGARKDFNRSLSRTFVASDRRAFSDFWSNF